MWFLQNPQTRRKKTRTVISAEKAKTADVNLLGAKVDWPMLVFNNASTTMHDTWWTLRIRTIAET